MLTPVRVPSCSSGSRRLTLQNNDLNEAIVASIEPSAIPRIDPEAILAMFGPDQGPAVVDQVKSLVREAVSMPIEWGDKTLVEGVRDILGRFHQLHPELSEPALREIGRIV